MTAREWHLAGLVALKTVIDTRRMRRFRRRISGDKSAAGADRGRRRIRRAEEIAQRLADRFPEDESMQAAVEEIRKARERRAAQLMQRPPARRRR